MGFVYHFEKNLAVDPDSGFVLRYLGKDQSFWDIQDAHLVEVNAPDFKVEICLDMEKDSGRGEDGADVLYIRPGPSPAHFCAFPEGNSHAANVGWLQQNYETVRAGLANLWSMGGTQPVQVVVHGI